MLHDIYKKLFPFPTHIPSPSDRYHKSRHKSIFEELYFYSMSTSTIILFDIMFCIPIPSLLIFDQLNDRWWPLRCVCATPPVIGYWSSLTGCFLFVLRISTNNLLRYRLGMIQSRTDFNSSTTNLPTVQIYLPTVSNVLSPSPNGHIDCIRFFQYFYNHYSHHQYQYRCHFVIPSFCSICCLDPIASKWILFFLLIMTHTHTHTHTQSPTKLLLVVGCCIIGRIN